MSGPKRRGSTATLDTGLNYTAIGATVSNEVVSFPPDGFRAAEYRHRIGSGARRFDLAGRALMTWGALRSAGFAVEDIRAEAATTSARGTGPLYLDDGTPWITPGMTAMLSVPKPAEWSGPVKVVSVFDEPGRIGYVYGSCPGNPTCGERLLLLEHDADDSVSLTVRSIWAGGPRWSPSGRSMEAVQRKLDERIVRALHPSNAA